MSSFGTDIDDEIVAVMNQLGDTIMAIMKAQVPRKSGRLHNSIRYKIIKNNGEYQLSFYYLYYGVYVDLGTYDNANVFAYGLPATQLPAWNPNPGKGGKGIRPRYWTSLSQDANEISEWLTIKLGEVLEDGITGLFRTSTQTKTT